MTTFKELDALDSRELHDRAVSHAEKHLDVKFLLNLIEALPAAEAAAGNLDQSSADIFHVGSLVRDIFKADEGELAETLRPFYIDYLLKHG
ncbi:MAG: hypothetical protein WAO61_10300 [Solirubrobacterales bacterium]